MMTTELTTIDDLKQNEEQLVNEIVQTRGDNLPANVEQVLQVFEFTDWKAKAWKTLSEKLSRLEDQQEAYHSALRSGQQWGAAALYSYKKLGELSSKMDKKDKSKNLKNSKSIELGGGDFEKIKTLKENKIDFREAYNAEKVYNNESILDHVVERSQEKGEIPTKSAVLNTIRAERAKEKHKSEKKKSDDKLDNQRPQAVADYYEAVKGYKSAIELAKVAAERGKFAPEGKNFLQKKHNELRQMMEELEALI